MKTKAAAPKRTTDFAGVLHVAGGVDSALAAEARAFAEAMAQLDDSNRKAFSLLHEDKCSRFKELLWDWKTSTRYVSSVDEMVLHPAYQQIVGMGEEALPLLLRELLNEPDHLFHALNAITGANPVPPEHFGDVTAMTGDWLGWARTQGCMPAGDA